MIKVLLQTYIKLMDTTHTIIANIMEQFDNEIKTNSYSSNETDYYADDNWGAINRYHRFLFPFKHNNVCINYRAHEIKSLKKKSAFIFLAIKYYY